MTKTVLLVEDDHDMQTKIEDAIKSMNLNMIVKKAENAKTAQAIIRAHTIHILIIDIMLPDGNGIDFAKNLRKSYPHTPIIIESSIKDSDTILDAYDDVKCLSFLKKPFSQNDVQRTITNVLGLETFFENTNPRHNPQRIPQKTLTIYKNRNYHLNLDEIIYIDLKYNATRIHMLDAESGEVSVHEILRYPLKKVLIGIKDTNDLIQCHKSFLINPDYILQYLVGDKIELKHISKSIPIGRTYRNNFSR